MNTKGCHFTREELIEFAKQYARKHWYREFDIDIELVNREWKRRMACYIYNVKTGKKIIRMSKKTNARLSNEVVLGNLLHELVHWHLHTTGKPFSDDAEEFVAECIRVGAPFSKTKSAQEAFRKYLQGELYRFFE